MPGGWSKRLSRAGLPALAGPARDTLGSVQPEVLRWGTSGGHSILNFEPRFLFGSEAQRAGWGVGAPPEGLEYPPEGKAAAPSPGPVAGRGLAPGARVAGLRCGGCGCSPAEALLAAVEQLALGAPGADAPAREVRAQQRVLLLTLWGRRHSWARPPTVWGGRLALPGVRDKVRAEASSGQAAALRPEQPHLACVPSPSSIGCALSNPRG